MRVRGVRLACRVLRAEDQLEAEVSSGDEDDDEISAAEHRLRIIAELAAGDGWDGFGGEVRALRASVDELRGQVAKQVHELGSRCAYADAVSRKCLEALERIEGLFHKEFGGGP
jgi:hypothetical protein